MNNQFVSFPPYYTYQSDSKKTSKFLNVFSHLPFLSSRNTPETKGLIGFSLFVVFILLLALSGIIGLSFIGNFFRKVDRLKNSDFSIDVQDGFLIQNQQLSNILQIPQSNRTKVQKDVIEVEKIFIETKLGDLFKSNLNNNFKNIYNIRFLSNINNDFINVSYTVRTMMMPKKNIKKFRNSLIKSLNSENFYKNLQISQDSKIISENFNPIISDPIEGEIFGSLQSSNSISVLRDSGDKKLSKKTIIDEVFPSVIVEKPSTIFPFDPYLDKIEYDRPFYDLYQTQPYFEHFKNRYDFSDENLSEKKLNNENEILKSGLESSLELEETFFKPKFTTKKISSQEPIEDKSEKFQIENEITTKTPVNAVADDSTKPNEVKLSPNFTTRKIKTLDEILQDLINETMLKNSEITT